MSDRTQSGEWPQSATTVLIGPSALTAECWQFARPDGLPFEYPGHGRRERREGWTHQSVAQEIVESYDGPLDVLGVSTGAAIVVDLLLHHAARIRSAIVIRSESLTSEEETSQHAVKRAAEIDRQTVVGDEEGRKSMVEATMARWFSPYALRANIPGVRYARETLLKTDPRVWHDAAMAELKSTRVPLDALEAVTRPVTIVGGLHDPAWLHNAAQIHSMIPNSRFEIWPASRMVHLEQPEFIQAIVDRHRIWAPTGNRVEVPLGTCVWLNLADEPPGSVT